MLTIASEERRTLDDDEYWPESLLRLEVRDPTGERLGSVEAVEIGEIQDRLVILTAQGERAFVPFVRALVLEIRLDDGYLVVEHVEGLLNSSPD